MGRTADWKTYAARAAEVRAFIENYTGEHGYAPTIREIMEEQGLSSTSSVWEVLKQMRAEGSVDWRDGKSRTIRVTDATLPARGETM